MFRLKNILAWCLVPLGSLMCLVVMNLLRRRLDDEGIPLRTDGIFGVLQSSENPLFTLVDATATFLEKTLNEMLAGMLQFDFRQLQPVGGMIVGMVMVFGGWFAIDVFIQKRRERISASVNYASKQRQAANVITSLPLEDRLMTDAGLHALSLPQRQATRFLKSAELLSIRINDAHMKYVRHTNEGELKTTQHTAAWYEKQSEALDPIIEELRTCYDQWQTFNGNIQTTQQKSTPDALNKRLLVLEVTLEDTRETLPAKRHYGLKVDRTRQCEHLIQQVAILRQQLDYSSRSNWEIHSALERIEEASVEFLPAPLAEVAK